MTSAAETIGVNAWCHILQFVDIKTLLNFALTCRYASKIVHTPSTRDTILSKMKLEYVSYMESSKQIIYYSDLALVPQQIGNILIYNNYGYPLANYNPRISMGFFKGTSTRYYYYHCPGRCDDFKIQIINDTDENGKVAEGKQLYINSSSHGTFSVSYSEDETYCELINGGPCEKPEEWQLGINFIKRLLQLAGFAADMESWVTFAKQMGISTYYTVFFHPPGPELDKMIGNVGGIYPWLNSLNVYY